MCPVCISTVMLTAAGATSTGGLAAFTVKKFVLKPERNHQTNETRQTEWLVARRDLLTREKELTRLRDKVSRHRRELPWVRINKKYVFDGPDGKETLVDLFDGRSQLI